MVIAMSFFARRQSVGPDGEKSAVDINALATMCCSSSLS